MIYTILAIPFGAAWLYFFAASRIQNKCFRELTDEEKEEFDLVDLKDDEVKMFDATRAGRWLAVMAVCWYIGYPVIQLEKMIRA